MQIYIAAPPGHAAAAAKTGYPVADMSCRVGSGFRLYRAHGSPRTFGGVMVVDTTKLSGGGPMRALTGEILSECEKYGCTGVVLDTGGGKTPYQALLARTLADDAAKLALFVPEALAECETAFVLVQTALSGGSLRRHLTGAMKKYGARRVALEVDRVRMDFTLPAPSGVGAELTERQLRELTEKHGAKTHFSDTLYVNYYTYHDKNSTHFVLLDDENSLREKLKLGFDLGIRRAFLYYPHIADLTSGLSF
jgi:hypothetical protein